MATQITEAQFEEQVLKAQTPVLVDFFATWCGPCKMMAPVLDELSSELEGSAAIYKIDVDQDPSLAQQYRVVSVPTMLVFKDGEVVNQFVGAQPKTVLAQALS